MNKSDPRFIVPAHFKSNNYAQDFFQYNCKYQILSYYYKHCFFYLQIKHLVSKISQMHASLQSLISSQKRFYSCPSHFFFLNSLILKCCYIYSIRNSFWKKFVFLHNTKYIKIMQIIKMKKKPTNILHLNFHFSFCIFQVR